MRDEAVHTVLLRIVRVGPRGVRDGDPDSDAGVRGYLGQALKNAVRDLVRAQRRFVDEQPEIPISETESEPLWPREALERAGKVLFELCVPCYAATLRADARAIFGRVIDDRKSMADGTVDFGAIVARNRGEVTPRTRNAVYKEQSRALCRLGEYIENYNMAQQLSRVDAEALRIAFAELSNFKD
jgi:hypothetical protein